MIELFTVPKCAGCEAVKKALAAELIEFREVRFDQLDYGAQAQLIADLRLSGHYGALEELCAAPIARNPKSGEAIPASVLCSGDPVEEVRMIL